MKSKEEVSFEYLTHLRKFHAAWRLVASDSAPFVASFLHKAFLQTNRRSISILDLIDELDNFIYVIKQKQPDLAPTRSAKEYVEIWSSPDTAWLSQRYIGRGDVPQVDLTPEAEKALRWLENLQPRTFVGTESRLLTIFQLLKELNQKIETNPEKALEDLYARKREIESQIKKLEQDGKLERLDSTQIKERYYQLDDTANTLLSDFRQVEDNFRKLDREVREKMSLNSKAKGAFLDDVFGEEDAITRSDQGRSFRAFWEFLIHNDRQMEFEEHLKNILEQPEVQALDDKGILPRFRDFLLEAGNKVYIVNNQLTSQLTKYLSSQERAENKRILDLASQVERQALKLQGLNLPEDFFFIPLLKPSLNLALNRPLFEVPDESELQVPTSVNFDENLPEEQRNKLFASNYIDENELLDGIERLLVRKDQVSLDEILVHYPLRKGLAELVAYLKLAEKRSHTVISDQLHFYVEIEHIKKQVRCPQVIFQRMQ